MQFEPCDIVTQGKHGFIRWKCNTCGANGKWRWLVDSSPRYMLKLEKAHMAHRAKMLARATSVLGWKDNPASG